MRNFLTSVIRVRSAPLHSSSCFGLSLCEVLLGLNLHKLVLAPRTGSKVGVFSCITKTGQWI